MKKFIPLIALLVLPAIALAQTVQTVIATVSNILNLVIPIVITLAVIYFFWGLAKYILNADNEEARTEGRSIMIYGIIALFVMVSVWGLIGLVGNTFNVGQGGSGRGFIPTL
ncbi:MAG: pilin [Candidatus Yonathbacteria bacterium]|nr:pilin [Candidatus Yonathbacteria bacterium]